jgi:AcrR family transcriptional regulator
MSAVAKQAEVAAGTVYNHFDGKAGLFAELFATTAAAEIAAVREVARDTAGEPPTQSLMAIVETFAGRALKAPKLAYALLAEPVEPELDALRLEFRTGFRDVLAAPIADGVRRGQLPAQRATVVAAALVGAISEALIGRLTSEYDDADTLPTLLTLIGRAVGGQSERQT